MSKVLLLVWLSFGVLTGCASTKSQQDADNIYDDLYERQSDVAHATEFPSHSNAEAIERGDRAYQMGQTDLALFHYVSALGFNPKDDGTLYKVGAINEALGNQVLAERAYRSVLQINLAHPGALERLGLMLLADKKYEESKGLLDKARAANPKNWQVLNALGILADISEDYEQALSLYQEALFMNPESPKLLNNVGYSFYLKGDWGKAEEHLQKAVEFDHTFKPAWMNLGLIHGRQGNYEASLDAFKKIMSNADAYNNAGYVALLDNEDGVAETMFQKAIELHPRFHEKASKNMGLIKVSD